MLVRDAARADAESTRESFWGNKYPVDPRAIAAQLGIEVFYRDLPRNVSGYILKRPGEDAEITVEASDSEARQRFTCAHEIGHYVERTTRANDDKFGFVDERTPKRTIHEFYADEFAGHLLMPEHEVRRLRRDESYDAIRMARYFGVSLPAMKVRLSRLGISG